MKRLGFITEERLTESLRCLRSHRQVYHQAYWELAALIRAGMPSCKSPKS